MFVRTKTLIVCSLPSGILRHDNNWPFSGVFCLCQSRSVD